MDFNYAQIVPLATPIDREMTYRVPDDLKRRIHIGSRALVPLGPRWTTGIVVDFQDGTDLEDVKSIGILLDAYPVVSQILLELCRWMAAYYVCTLSEVLTTALPAGIHTHSGQRIAVTSSNGADPGPITPFQRQVLDHLKSRGPSRLSQLQRRLRGNGVRGAVYGLIRRGLLTTRQTIEDPRVKPMQERMVKLVPDARWFEVEWSALERRAPRQAECLRRIRAGGGVMPAAALTRSGIGSHILKALADRRLVRIYHREVRRDPYAEVESTAPERLTLTDHQRRALEQIRDSLNPPRYNSFLLHGVTGSGKTLVYIRAVDRVLKYGLGALILVPEISLTPQTVRRFRSHFGNRVAVIHSALSESERYDAWRDVREGRRTIVIGARSAVFAPVSNLGLIVVDEEHDSAYKQSDPAPRYNARDVAVMRANMENIPIVLGSATPALESFHNVDTEKFRLLPLPERIDSRPLPEVTLVDMRKESGLFSRVLREKLKDRLEKKERVILLQNRRGYAPYVQCMDCGDSLQCPNCRVTLTYHAQGSRMVCHYCAYDTPAPSACRACEGTHLKLLGVGTQRVEEALNEQFSGMRLLRMDVDTTRRKGAHDRILESFRKGRADVLLGTQMVAKGLDFPGVTLVGVISADTGIHLPDFRAGERTFQLLTQVSGRAGRGHTPGEVVVQTYLPEGEAVQCARNHDFKRFAELELEGRRSVLYPPYGRMALLLFKGRHEHDVARTAGLCAEALRAMALPHVDVMGPAQAPLARIRRNFRWQVVLKTPSSRHLNALARRAMREYGRSRRAAVTLDVDIDPVSML
ncbi:MAG: primosomal protein N' [Gemmatimonadota bacterium]|nr:primosomal protein N' [Gemmatimonadota bacterium]